MKFLALVIIITTLFSCGNKSEKGKLTNKITDSTSTKSESEDKSYLKKRPEEFSDFFKLSNLQPFKGKIATREDLTSGAAVFVLNAKNNQEHQTCNIRLPFYAFKKGVDNKPVFVAIIQAEILMKDTILGYRQANGLYGMCRPRELEYFENDKDRVFNTLTPPAQ